VGHNGPKARTRCEGRGGPAARAASEPIQVQGITRRAVERVDRGSAERPLVQIGFAENYRSRVFKFGNNGCIEVRSPVIENLRAGSRSYASGREVVFDRKWNAMKRPAVTALRDFIFGFLRGCESVIGRDRNVGVKNRIQPLDPL